MYNELSKARCGGNAVYASVAEMTIGLQKNGTIRTAGRGRRICLCAGIATLFLVSTVAAQQPAAPQPPASPQSSGPSAAQPSVADQPAPPAATAQAPAAKKQPGFFEELGRWFEKSTEEFNANWKKAGRSLSEFGDNAGSAAKGATEAMIKLSSTRVVVGNERCELAPNGSPDCRKAAEAVCRAKGFATGQSLDTQSARKCPASVWLSGRAPNDRECAVETFVTRAACQEPR